MSHPSDQSQAADVRAVRAPEQFGQYVDAVWQARIFILLATGCVTALALTASLLLPKRYEASAVVMPVTSESSGNRLGGAAALASQFGGLARLAGLTLPSASERAETIATLQSETLTQRYIAEHELLPILFPDLYDSTTKKWLTPNGAQPSLWRASQFFKRRVRSVVEEKKTGLVKVTVSWTDPQVAAEWANGLIELTNEYLRSKAIEESDRNIGYLSNEALRADLLEVRTAIYSVLESEIKNAMLARGSREYALRVVDRAFIPEKAASPRPVLWTFTALCVGALLSIAAVTVLRAIKPLP